MKKRASFLSLDLECSGFFADKIDLLKKEVPNCKFVFLIRHPESWIGSVVNYFAKLDDAVSYNYVARMVFDPVCTYPIEKFYSLPHYKKVHIVEALLKYWIDVYSKAKAEDLALVVRLDEVDASVGKIKDFTGLDYIGQASAWRRENNDKKHFSLSDYVDLRGYERCIRDLGYEV